MDIASVVGLAGSAILVIGTMFMGGTFEIYLDLGSAIIVMGGAIMATMARWPMDGFIGGMMAGLKAITGAIPPPSAIIDQIIELAEVARKGSILALESVQIDEPFLAKTVRLMVDGYDPKVIDELVEMEIDNMYDRHADGRTVFENMAEACPAYGMIGTVIGLVVIMSNLDDPDAIGPGLATALITTLYGSMAANMIFIPLAGKLKWRSKEELLNMEIIRYGVAAITKGENPRAIREKLESFLSNSERNQSEA